MNRHTCMGCGLKTRWLYGSWPDRHPWAAMAFVAPAKIVSLTDRNPTAAMALVVPGTLVGLLAVAAYPFVFGPLIILVGVALVASVRYEETRYEESGRNPACSREDCPEMRSKAGEKSR